ncbi:hypothetical protein [Streptomyces sp. NPDC051211]|uniref:hypothetical protein n=1 Tax=Streptomyces sp. NPDC051211 TaxID=3154643 RepID=UPI00344CBDFF
MSLDLPGGRPDTEVNIPTCIEIVPANNVRGKAILRWQMMVDQADIASKRFTSFKVTTRLENRDAGGTDVVVTSKTCDFTADVNMATANDPTKDLVCLSPAATLDSSKQWSGDATAVYDVEGDGKGPITWHLNGSPLMS